jgi:hypothetical protein
MDAIMGVRSAVHSLGLHLERGYDDPTAHRYNNITRKYRAIRREFLGGTWDALLTMEDDIQPPFDAPDLLASVEADVVYGLTVWRNPPHYSSAQVTLEPGGVLNMHSGLLVERWGGEIDVEGCGLFCTLIHRHVVEALDFHRDGAACCDWDFAADCLKHGFTQAAHTGVLCGHMEGGCTYWHTNEAPFWRVECAA